MTAGRASDRGLRDKTGIRTAGGASDRGLRDQMKEIQQMEHVRLNSKRMEKTC